MATNNIFYNKDFPMAVEVLHVNIFRAGSKLELEINCTNLTITNNSIPYIPEKHAEILDRRTSAEEKIKVLHKHIETIILKVRPAVLQTKFY